MFRAKALFSFQLIVDVPHLTNFDHPSPSWFCGISFVLFYRYKITFKMLLKF